MWVFKALADMVGLSTFKLAVYLGIALFVIASITTIYLSWKGDIQEEVRQKIEDANAKRETEAFEGVNDVNVCYARGGDWDRTRGLCLKGKPGP